MKNEQWIDIADSYPQLGQGVLIALNTGVITIGYRQSKLNGRSHNWQIFGDLEFLGLHKHDYVTHWMELPKPPNFNEKNINTDDYQYPKQTN